MNEGLCTKLCEAAKIKILELKDCYDTCVAERPAAECENQCFAEVRAIAQRVESGEIIVKVSSDAVAIVGGGRKVEILSNESIDLLELDGKKFIKVPVNLSAGEKLVNFTDPESGIRIDGDIAKIPMKDENGNVNSQLVLYTKDGVVGEDGRGKAEIEDIKLEVNEKSGKYQEDVKGSAQFATPKMELEADLKDVIINSSVTTKAGDMTDADKNKFEEIVEKEDKQKRNATVNEVVVFEVSKKNLDNVKHVNNVTVRIKVDKKAVEGKTVELVRKDGSVYEVLKTTLVGEENGMLIFEGYSPNGFSLYALMTVEYMAPTTEEKKLPIETVLVGAVVIIAIAAGAVFFLGRKGGKKGNSTGGSVKKK
jgi:PGF-pre-PGF domain-containing protein